MSLYRNQSIRRKLSIATEYSERIESKLEPLISPLPKDPVRWAEKVRILEGKPFSFEDRDYLLPMYRDTSNRIVIVKGRQVEVTELGVNWLLKNLTTFPYTKAIYTAPKMEKVREFSRDRFRPAILDSEQLKKKLSKGEEKEDKGGPAITRIAFKNRSVCYLITAWGDFNAIRGIALDFAFIDEFQDLQGDALPIVIEAMAHSKFRKIVGAGTASLEGDPFSKLWDRSDKKEWSWEEKAWSPTKPENSAWSGYHIGQDIAPWIMNLPPEDDNSIPWKRAHYIERIFFNEVLGRFYRGMAKPLIPQDFLGDAQNPGVRDFSSSLLESYGPPEFSYAGIDWGGGIFAFTIIWIMAKDKEGRWRLLYIHKFDEKDPMRQVEIIGNLLDAFTVRLAVADIGYGQVQVSELQKKFGNRLWACRYVENPQVNLRKIDKDDRGDRISQLICNADRSFWIDKAIDVIKHRDAKNAPDPLLKIPWTDQLKVEWLIDHFTCIEREDVETVGGKRYYRYVHNPGEPDDALHTFVYSLIAEALDSMVDRSRPISISGD